ncbi:MAG TPA: alpha/beta hydrolase fold domain-containing protein [Anaerolineaceae bacterium]
MWKKITLTRLLVFLCLAILLSAVAGCRFKPSPTSLPAPVQPAPAEQEKQIWVGGVERSYLVHFPTGWNTRPAGSLLPLVIVLHGGGGNAQNAARMSGMSLKADQEGFLVVYPNGSGRLDELLLTWNSGNCCGYALDQKVDDVAFLRVLIEQLKRDYPVDPARVYLTGMSNGGMMAYRAGCELAGMVAAIAPVAGALNVPCKPDRPVAVVAFHGTADQHVLYEGGTPVVKADSHDRVDQPVSAAIDFWVKNNGCDPQPQKEQQGNILRTSYTGCTNQADVTLFSIIGGGHAWPGGNPWVGAQDQPTMELSATNEMWKFFSAHPQVSMGAGKASTPAALANPPSPAVTPKSGAVFRDIPYCRGGKELLHLDAYYPAQVGSAPLKAALFIHGGGWTSGNKGGGGQTPEALALLARGYLVFSIDYRLAPEAKFPAQIEDAKCAVRHLRANARLYQLDPDRIGVWGSSAGGHLVALLGTADASAGLEGSGGYPGVPSRVQAVVDLFGPADLPLYGPRFLSTGVNVFGARSLDDPVLKIASPVTYASRDDPPFLILQGDQDVTVPPEQSQALYNRLKAAGGEVTLVMVKNAGHGFTPVGGQIDPSRFDLAKMTADFFDRWLK